jgi:hypothetical protein
MMLIGSMCFYFFGCIGASYGPRKNLGALALPETSQALKTWLVPPRTNSPCCRASCTTSAGRRTETGKSICACLGILWRIIQNP